MSRNKETRKKYLEKNAVKIAEQKKAWYEANKNTNLAYQKEWNKNNKVKIRAYRKYKCETDPLYKLKANIKNLIGGSLKNNGYKKLSRTEQILGCSYAELKVYLESKFESWMSWDNRGAYNGEQMYGWDIDHIIPISSATCIADIIKLNHYTNLQPLCSYLNRVVKRNSLDTSVSL